MTHRQIKRHRRAQKAASEESVPVYDRGQLIGWFCWTWLGGPKRTRVFIPAGDVR